MECNGGKKHDLEERMGNVPRFYTVMRTLLAETLLTVMSSPQPSKSKRKQSEMKQNCRTIVPSSRNSAVTGSQPVMSSPLKRHLKQKISAGRARTDERWYEAPASFSNNSRNITNYSLPHFSLKLLYCLCLSFVLILVITGSVC